MTLAAIGVGCCLFLILVKALQVFFRGAHVPDFPKETVVEAKKRAWQGDRRLDPSIMRDQVTRAARMAQKGR